jgi:two-component system sensor histidine kinase YesM
VVLSLFFVIFKVRYSYRNIIHIFSLIEAAEKDEALPSITENSKDEYGMLVKNIIRSFVSESKLKRQLFEKKHELEKLEMYILQAQLGPHFLINTLRSVFWMSYKLTGKQNSVSQIIEKIIAVLDHILTRNETLVSIEREMTIAQYYIEIQQTRRNKNITVEWAIPEHLKKCYTIKLLIQPILENTVIHGAFADESTLNIKIQLQEQGQELFLTIIDNGQGMSRSKLKNVRKYISSPDNVEHIGLYNCNKRLILNFGNKYGLKIDSRKGIGTTICIHIPKLVNDISKDQH